MSALPTMWQFWLGTGWGASLWQFARPRGYLPWFEEHASPEAIKASLEAARDRQAELAEELGWLEGLYLRRAAEKAAGAWPKERDRG